MPEKSIREMTARRSKKIAERQQTRNINLRRRLICATLSLLLAAQYALAAWAANIPQARETTLAVDPVGNDEGFAAVLYDNTNGLPTSEANAIAQTSEGFIWIGSYSGLIRYDGNTFERIDSAATGIASVVYLYVDRLDRLWIGTNDSGVALMERGAFRLWNVEDGLGSAKVCAIAEDRNGTIYVGTTVGITMIYPNMSLRPLDDPRIAGAYIVQMCVGSDGLLYCTTNDGNYFALRDGELVEYVDSTEMCVQEITWLLPDPDSPGEFYIGTGNTGFYHGDLRRDIGEMDYVDVAPLFDVIDIKLIGEQIWICAGNGIGVLDGEGFHYLADLPLNNSIGKIMVDYEGNLWFTSRRQGVMKVVPNQFSDLFTRFSLPSCVVNSTCLYGDRLFIATDAGLMALDEDGRASAVPLSAAKTASGVALGASDLLELLEGCRIRSVIRDSRGRLWISTWRAFGLLRYDGKEITAFTEAEGLLSNNIRTVSETADGRMLVVNSNGLNVIEGDRVTAAYGENGSFANSESLTVTEAPNGDFVLGSNGDGIYIINETGVRHIGTRDGLSSGVVMRVKYDPVWRVFWLVTSNSIAWMTEDYRVTTVRSFPYSNNYDLYENSRGDMWILSSNGIYVLPAEELLGNGEVKPVHYGMANGLPCIATVNAYSELTEDGELYIAGNLGVVKVNIETPMENADDLKVAVPFLDADGVRIYPDETGGFTIGSRVRKLTIYSYVYNYSLTDPYVTYQLEGFDRDGVTVRRSSLVPADYTNLRGGTYHFVLRLRDPLGDEGKKVSVRIVKEKAFYEEAWFFAVAGIAVTASLVTGGWLYLRRRLRLLEEKHREEVERERIGAELSMAASIQAHMLPSSFPPFPDRSEFDLYATMDSAKEVGGDFYDFFMVDHDHLALVVADVSGKGVPAALFSMIAKTILKTRTQAGGSPAQVLWEVNARLSENNDEDMFVTVWLGILEISTGTLTYADAGHEKPLLYRDGKWSFVQKHNGVALALLGPELLDDSPFVDETLRLAPGDVLFQYTDGVPEATNAAEELFGDARLLDAMNAAPSAKPEELLPYVRAKIDAFVGGAPQFDDITMLALRLRGGAETTETDGKETTRGETRLCST